MNKTRNIMKASFLQLRIYLFILLGITVASFTSQIIEKEESFVSIGNMLTTFLIIMAIVLPVSFYKRILSLGATRKEYYINLLAIYSVWTSGYAAFNILWFKLEKPILKDYLTTYNILEVFHWDQFGVAGMFIYQLGAYMMVISLFNLLFSGLRHFIGRTLWALLIVATPISVSIPSLRSQLADAFHVLLFNDSLLHGFGLTLIISCVFFIGGWYFIRKRVI